MARRTLRRLSGAAFTRRHLFRTTGAGVASAVIAGAGVHTTNAAPDNSASATRMTVSPADLHAVDPNLFTARSAPLFQVGGQGVRILPIARAKLLAGARFDLRVEALGLTDPSSATIRLDVTGPNGLEPLLTGNPVRSSASPTSLEVTYVGQQYIRGLVPDRGDARGWRSHRADDFRSRSRSRGGGYRL